jgi:hypothetical protein
MWALLVAYCAEVLFTRDKRDGVGRWGGMSTKIFDLFS